MAFRARAAWRALGRWLVWATLALSVAFPVALAASILLLRYVGESWWVTSVGLYLPRWVLAGPLLVLGGALVVLRRWKLLALQAVSAWLLLFPLLGFVLPSWRSSAGGRAIRILSYNANSIAAGPEALASSIGQFSPDVVLLQEVFQNPTELVAALRRTYAAVEGEGQFLIASRFPIRSTTTPPGFVYEGKSHTAHYMRHELVTPFGPLVVYNVHPISPRRTILKARGIRGELVSGRFWEGQSAEINRENSALRELELATAAERGQKEATPLVIAGDTNLPALSPVLARYFSGYQDGFARAGWGFGYTYPRRLPWMRIDRIFASHDLEFVSFAVGCGKTSDHLCVTADIRLAEP